MTVFKRRPKKVRGSDKTGGFVKVIQRCRDIISTKYPDLCFRTSIIIGCPDAEKEHARSFRQFAHVGHYEGAICFSIHATSIHLGFQYGLLLHEYGHLINSFLIDNGVLPKESYTEETADRMIRDAFAIKIEYRHIFAYRRPDTFQRGVEWVDPHLISQWKPTPFPFKLPKPYRPNVVR